MRIVVVGGGIGGLSAAISLRDAGHEVTVFEQVAQLSEVGAGIGMAPNATYALKRLGAADLLEPLAVKPRSWQRRHWSDGEVFAAVPLGEEVSERFGNPFWTIHRGDMHAALLASARTEAPGLRPIDIRTSTRIDSVDPERGAVVTAAGERIEADLIVGADGVRSVVLPAVAGDVPAVYSGNIAFRVQFATADLAASHEFDEFVENREEQTWLGPDGHLVVMTIRGGAMINCTFCLTEPVPLADAWSAPATLEDLLSRIQGWYPPLVRLVASAKSTFRWDLYDRDPIPSWSAGKAVLVGDAAHAMIPYLGQGAAQALEDAVVLGETLAGVEPDGLPGALAAYEAQRRERATRVQLGSRANRDVFHIPDGPEQRGRDARIAREAPDLANFEWLWRIPGLMSREAR